MWGFQFPKWLVAVIFAVSVIVGFGTGSWIVSGVENTPAIAIGSIVILLGGIVGAYLFLGLSAIIAFLYMLFDKEKSHFGDYFPNDTVSIWAITSAAFSVFALVAFLVGIVVQAL